MSFGGLEYSNRNSGPVALVAEDPAAQTKGAGDEERQHEDHERRAEVGRKERDDPGRSRGDEEGDNEDKAITDEAHGLTFYCGFFQDTTAVNGTDDLIAMTTGQL